MIKFKLIKSNDDIILQKEGNNIFKAEFSKKNINIEELYEAIGITNKDEIFFDVNDLLVKEAKGEEEAFQKFTVEFLDTLFKEIIKVTNKKSTH